MSVPTPAMRQEAATTGSWATNILSFSITAIGVSLSLSRVCARVSDPSASPASLAVRDVRTEGREWNVGIWIWTILMTSGP